MNTQTIIQLLGPVLDLFDQLGILYRVGGSVATSYYGPQRATQDVDLIADISLAQVGSLVAGLDPQHYLIVDQSVIDAIVHHSSFNILDLTTMNKIDVFIQKQTAQAQQEQQRANLVALVPGTRQVWISSAEDMLLEKLLWWQLGGGVSTRQWTDIVGLIQHHAHQLDTSYLDASARSLAILPLLQRAYTDAGVAFP
jgi:hypothetical protein